MKRALIPLFSCILIGLIITIIFINQQESVDEIIVLEENHTYIYKKERSFNVDIYINNKTSMLLNTNAYKNTYVTNIKYENRHSLDIKLISLNDEERYLEKTFFHYILAFSLPSNPEGISIKDCLLHIELTNNKTYSFMIGSLEIYMVEPSLVGANFPLLMTSLQVTTNDLLNPQRIDKVYLEVSPLQYLTIERITLGSYSETTFNYDGYRLTIVVINEKKVLDNAPIIITYATEYGTFKQYFDNMQLLTTYRNLIKDGVKKNHYAFN